MKINITKAEATALYQTALNMRNDLAYFNFMSKAKFKKFCDSYETGLSKLQTVMSSYQNKKQSE